MHKFRLASDNVLCIFVRSIIILMLLMTVNILVVKFQRRSTLIMKVAAVVLVEAAIMPVCLSGLSKTHVLIILTIL